MLPRSQHGQISTCTKQRAQRYRRGVASACLPSSHRRGRGSPLVGYCPGIRASARCGARRRYELAGWDRRRACLQRRQTPSPPSSPFGVAASQGAYRRWAARSASARQRALRAASTGRQLRTADCTRNILTAAVSQSERGRRKTRPSGTQDDAAGARVLTSLYRPQSTGMRAAEDMLPSLRRSPSSSTIENLGASYARYLKTGDMSQCSPTKTRAARSPRQRPHHLSPSSPMR
jgi:hypothetical protein